ncbi:hypothetical protein ICW40_06250 [Actinotalea ferrariae]|uniref:M66 family metalloprotease n=1 Tax=Actinotalea ferrariae TaxID=1386098 RepID=UPI001C8C76F9|nr:M66 family metalloprotease [Actinotalea ferrariae]MBX9244407.1 hypothetical protein [Actinotalea ferrariae]
MDLSRLVRSDIEFERIIPKNFHTIFGLFFDGIEVTQAIQYQDSSEHLTDPADRGTDNAVRLVAYKPAWVRVFVNSIFGAGGVTATLEVQRRHSGFLWTTIATLSPDPSSMTSVPSMSTADYAARRGSAGGSINFVIPANEMIGTLRLVAKVEAGGWSTGGQVQVAATLRQTLRLAGVMIAYNGPASMAANAPNLTIAAPGLADLQAMSGTTLTLFPVESQAQFRTAGTLTLTTHLQQAVFPASGCGPNWDALHGRVANARTADGNQPGWIYYGLLPAGVPMGPVGGCGGGGVAVGPVGQPGTLAHEAGHAAGLAHAPAGGAPNADVNYPAYEPYDTPAARRASIGEYGLNVNTGAVASPATFRDFMAYGGPSWIGLYHYGRLTDNDRFTPRTVGIDHFWWKDLVWEEVKKWPPIPDGDPPFDLGRPPFELELPMFPPSRAQDVLSLIVKVERGKVTEVMHVARVSAHTALRGAVETSFTVNLRDEQGAVLASGALMRLDTDACGCGGGAGTGGRSFAPTSYLAQAFVPDVAPGASIDITKGDDVVWRREAPSEPPQVRVGDAEVDERRGEVRLEWDASSDVAEYWLRWSADGERWQSVATGLTERGARVPIGDVPAGDGLLQVVAHDGFHSVYSEPVRISLPERPPSMVVLHPVEGHTYVGGQTVRLWASVVGERDEAEREEAVWSVDGQDVARGLDAWTTLEPGERTVTVRLRDGEASVRVQVERPQG